MRRSSSSITEDSTEDPAWMFPTPPRPLDWRVEEEALVASRERERFMLPAPPRPVECCKQIIIHQWGDFKVNTKTKAYRSVFVVGYVLSDNVFVRGFGKIGLAMIAGWGANVTSTASSGGVELKIIRRLN